MQTHPALVLNADFQPLNYFPLSTMNWQTAVKNVYEGNLSVVEEYETVVRSPSTTMRLPSVVAMRDFVPIPKRVAFTRFNVFLRDRFRCQYCGHDAFVTVGPPPLPSRPHRSPAASRGMVWLTVCVAGLCVLIFAGVTSALQIGKAANYVRIDIAQKRA